MGLSLYGSTERTLKADGWKEKTSNLLKLRLVARLNVARLGSGIGCWSDKVGAGTSGCRPEMLVNIAFLLFPQSEVGC